MYKENKERINMAELTLKIVLISILIIITVFAAFKMNIIPAEKITGAKNKIVNVLSLNDKTNTDIINNYNVEFDYINNEEIPYNTDWSTPYFEKYGFTKYESAKDDISYDEVCTILSKLSNKSYVESPFLYKNISFEKLAYKLNDYEFLGDYASNLSATDVVQMKGIINSYCLTRDE